MKKENLNQKKGIKGITLVALVVTIVVLLILAGITITMLFSDNGIITKAREAADAVNQSQSDTLNGLENLADSLADALSDGNWKDNGNGTFTNGSKTITIGDFVTYNPGSYTHTPDTTKGAGTGKSDSSYSGYTPRTITSSQVTTQSNFTSWRVLGVNSKGQLELISSEPTTQQLWLANDTGYLNAETIYNADGSIKQLGTLDAFCNDLYGKGSIIKDGKTQKIAESARSLNVDDIDKLSKYDKTTYSRYGEKWQYQFPTDGNYMQYRKKGTALNASYSSWSDITHSSYQKFRTPESTEVISSSNRKEGPELESTYYYYSIARNITTEDGYTSELATVISDMITKGTESSDISQWLASHFVNCMLDFDAIYTRFSVRILHVGNVSENCLLVSTGLYSSGECHVRPVVTLETGVKLTSTGERPGSSGNPYTLDK